jgi:hypothetical protein
VLSAGTGTRSDLLGDLDAAAVTKAGTTQEHMRSHHTTVDRQTAAAGAVSGHEAGVAESVGEIGHRGVEADAAHLALVAPDADRDRRQDSAPRNSAGRAGVGEVGHAVVECLAAPQMAHMIGA